MKLNPMIVQWQQTTANVYDESGRALSLLPIAIASGDGNVIVSLYPFQRFNPMITTLITPRRS